MATVVIGCMDAGQLQNTQEIKRTFFYFDETGQNMQIFEKPSFSSYAQHKNRKTNN